MFLSTWNIQSLFLVQHPEHIRITDFGLSKLLDHNESEVRLTEEKVLHFAFENKVNWFSERFI